jgi:hypothetical protein
MAEYGKAAAEATSASARLHFAHARLMIGAGAAAIGLFAAFQWVGVPGADLSLAQDKHRTDSVAAFEQLPKPTARRALTAPSATSGGRSTTHSSHEAGARQKSRQTATKADVSHKRTNPRLAPAPAQTRSGDEGAGTSPPAGGSSETVSGPAPRNTGGAPPPPPASSLPPVEVPQFPQVPFVPTPTVPAATVPDLPAPKLP